jgi:hypothetical protein
MQKESHALLSSAGRAFNRQRYYNVPAVALIPLGKQFMNFGGNDEKIGQSIVRGVIQSLGGEEKEAFPRCPHCGQRRPPVSTSASRAKVAAVLSMLLSAMPGGSKLLQ